MKEVHKQTIDTIKNAFLDILKNQPFETYDQSNIYFITDNKIKNKLKSLERNAIALDLEIKKEMPETKTSKKRGVMYNIAKIINSDDAIGYKFYMKHKYVSITKKESVIKELGRIQAIELNKTNKKCEDTISDNPSLSNEKIQDIRNECKDQINYINKMHEFLIENFDILDIKITTFVDETIYPTIYLVDIAGGNKDDFLRAGVPNIVYAHKHIFVLEKRKNATVIQFILEAQKAFGNIYYKYKKGLNPDEQ